MYGNQLTKILTRGFLKIKTLKVPTVAEWLKSQLRPGDRVGADPKLVSADQWTEWRRELGKRFVSLFGNENFVTDPCGFTDWTIDGAI